MQKPLLVTDFLDRARRYYGDCEAVVGTDGSRYTYNEIGSRADGFSAALKRVGVEKGDRVAVLDPNTHYHLEAAYGTFQIGGFIRRLIIDSSLMIMSISSQMPMSLLSTLIMSMPRKLMQFGMMCQRKRSLQMISRS